MKSKVFWVLGTLLTLSILFALHEVADNELFGQRLFHDDAGVPMLLLGAGTMWSLALVLLHELVARERQSS
jgi:hypothetical protein